MRLFPVIFFVHMLTKELSTLERVQPRFIEPMYAEAVRELPDGGLCLAHDIYGTQTGKRNAERRWQLTGDGLYLHDHLWGKKPGGGPVGVALRALAIAHGRTACATD